MVCWRSWLVLSAITRDPWAAIARPLPKRADTKTLLLIYETATLCALFGRSLDDDYEQAARAMSRADADAFDARLVELGHRLKAADRADDPAAP